MLILLEQEKPCLVLDATHPHAAAATKHISCACKRAGILCLRVLREEPGEALASLGQDMPRVYWVDTPREAVKLLEMDRESVLLTTGSKELGAFAAAKHLAGRIYARVLPDSQVVAECERLGISGRFLIAMQGPFSVEMNRALIHGTGAGWLVTKESGSRGGFAEKMEAAAGCKIRVIVIRRPRQEEGISAWEAREELQKLAERQCQKREKKGEKRRLYLIGMGMGSGSQLTLEAWKALGQCEVVLGAPRMLGDVMPWTEEKPRVPVYLGEDVWRWLEDHPEYKNVGVVYSGDTGFYSGCCSLMKKGRERAGDFQIQVFPGISTMSCLCARLGRSWETLYPASLHGRDCDMERLLQEHREVFLLLGEEDGLGRLCQRLVSMGLGHVQVAAGIRLGYPDEQVAEGRAEELKDWQGSGLAAVILKQ